MSGAAERTADRTAVSAGTSERALIFDHRGFKFDGGIVVLGAS